ncbi:16116_t:CDS:2 [Acaulospora colombiana]|uniref:16116_t:CDS:1 n=1 Tax=Acaulospora colombiana TaxID=27376 RepID=A0ACA9L5I6_9GLOM|nr:16116_t:CDS:2 [Acaulospora colombiana]
MWLFTDTDSVIPHVFPICILLDDLANERYVVEGKDIDLTMVSYLSDVVSTECASLIQQMAIAFDECIMDVCTNDVSQSHLSEVIVRNFLDQSFVGRESNMKEYRVMSAHGVINITRNSDINLNQMSFRLYNRLETKSETFWLIVLKCIGLSSQSVARKLIQGLLLTLFQATPSDDQVMAERMINVRELISTLDFYWKDVFRLSVESLIEMTLVHEETELATYTICTQYMNIYKALVYFIVTDLETSSIKLSDLTETFPYLPDLILRKLMLNSEKVRNWPFALRSSEKLSTNLELLSRRQSKKGKKLRKEIF